jgi:hypothetical protein
MGKVSSLSESAAGVPERVAVADFVKGLQSQAEVEGATWLGDSEDGILETSQQRDLAQAIAIAAKAAFDEKRDAPHAVRTSAGRDLQVLAGETDALAALESGPDAPDARTVDFAKGGKGLKLIWAAFVLDRHRVQTWSNVNHRASVGFRIPLVQA